MKTFRLFDELLVSSSTPNSLQQFLKSSGVAYERKALGKSIHIRSKSKGFQIQYEQGVGKQQNEKERLYKAGAIFLYLNNQKNSRYGQNWSLPYHLSQQTTIQGAAMLLGEPTSKSKFVTECIWDNLGVDIVFCGGVWHDPGLIIDYICLFQSPVQRQNECSICHSKLPKNCTLLCLNCHLVKYCGPTCMEKYHRLHQIHCQQIDED